MLQINNSRSRMDCGRNLCSFQHRRVTAVPLLALLLLFVNESSCARPGDQFYHLPAAAPSMMRDPHYPHYPHYPHNYYDSYWPSVNQPPPPASSQLWPNYQLESSFQLQKASAKTGGDERQISETVDPRFFGTLTLTLGSSISTLTVTTTTTCTTSTTAIKVCSPSKGRRRRSNFGIHRLMFDEEEFDESAIFAPRKPEDDHHQQQQRNNGGESSVVIPIHSSVDDIESRRGELIPFVVEPGFRSEIGQGRFFVAFASSTLTSTITSTYFYILTATCKSTTFYQNCGTGFTNVISGRKNIIKRQQAK